MTRDLQKQIKQGKKRKTVDQYIYVYIYILKSGGQKIEGSVKEGSRR